MAATPACGQDLRSRARLGCHWRDVEADRIDKACLESQCVVDNPVGALRRLLHASDPSVEPSHDAGKRPGTGRRVAATVARYAAAAEPDGPGLEDLKIALFAEADATELAGAHGAAAGETAGLAAVGGAGGGAGAADAAKAEAASSTEATAAACADGHHVLYHRGQPDMPMTLWVRGVESRAPACYLTLPSSLPTAPGADADGEAGDVPANTSTFLTLHNSHYVQGTTVLTSFVRVRVDPVSLAVKTDDYTFAQSTGEAKHSYWNGQRSITFHAVPFATARACHFSNDMATACVDVRGTPFRIASRFAIMGCVAKGHTRWDGGESTPRADGAVVLADAPGTPEDTPRQRVVLSGTGASGRICPEHDHTLNDPPARGDYPDEGRNGGWVLQLAWAGRSEA